MLKIQKVVQPKPYQPDRQSHPCIQYILFFLATRTTSSSYCLGMREILNIAQEDGFQLSFDLYFDL